MRRPTQDPLAEGRPAPFFPGRCAEASLAAQTIPFREARIPVYTSEIGKIHVAVVLRSGRPCSLSRMDPCRARPCRLPKKRNRTDLCTRHIRSRRSQTRKHPHRLSAQYARETNEIDRAEAYDMAAQRLAAEPAAHVSSTLADKPPKSHRFRARLKQAAKPVKWMVISWEPFP